MTQRSTFVLASAALLAVALMVNLSFAQSAGMWYAIPNCTKTAFRNCSTDSIGWPWTEAVHNTLTNTGKMLFFKNSGERGEFDSQDFPHYWDPSTRVDQLLGQTASPNDLFCSGTAVLADGRVILVGGEDVVKESIRAADGRYYHNPTGTKATYLFDPSTPSSGLIPKANMAYRRWYATPTILPDGRVDVVGGVNHRDSLTLKLPLAESTEVYVPSSNSWISTYGARKKDLWAYAFLHVLPGSGTRLLLTGPGARDSLSLRTLNKLAVLGDLETSTPAWSNLSSPTDQIRGGSYALFITNRSSFRILKTGGLPPGSGDAGAAVASAEVITIDSSTGEVLAVQSTNSMNAARTEHNLTVLADGTVLATAGLDSIGTRGEALTNCSRGVYTTEIWNPGSGLWSNVASMTHRNPNVPRTYHATALLLSDGSVLSAGGECTPSCPDRNFNNHPWCTSADIYYPPYLMDGSSVITDAQRPSTSNPPMSVAYGEGMSFTRSLGSGASSITKVALVRPGSVTHAHDTEARYIPFNICTGICIDGNGASFFTESLGILTVPAANMPDNKLAPPGYYMLFLVNNLTRPSKAPSVLFWGVIQPSIGSSNLVDNGDGTYDIDFSWQSTFLAVDGDYVTLVAAPPGGSVVPISESSGHSADGLTHWAHIKAYCTPGTWTYQVQSKRPRYATGTDKSISNSATKTFKITACIEP